jgi:DNA-binding NarL/FixJ family response regulator
MNRILLADPNPILRSAVALLLETRLDAQIVGQVSSMESLLYEAAATQPDLIVIGLNLPGMPAEERVAALHAKAPRSRILSFSMHPEDDRLSGGTVAFLRQSDPPEIILQTVQDQLDRCKQD